ncbi:unnamed protein product [Prorocentrum cordatum]|uniref:Uncharacterized protein n=1 Tax=Prorocentrum cordatum TaxID=2364126 RepID=A0ABN9X8S6_9DINO|nr:unnamed protein product [Polarella glacialis]
MPCTYSYRCMCTLSSGFAKHVMGSMFRGRCDTEGPSTLRDIMPVNTYACPAREVDGSTISANTSARIYLCDLVRLTMADGRENAAMEMSAAPPAWFSGGNAEADDADADKKQKGEKPDKTGGRAGAGNDNKLGVANARHTMTIARDVPDLKSTVNLRYEMPDSTKGVTAASKSAGAAYNKTSLEMKKTARAGGDVNYKERGPPHVHIVMAAVLHGAGKQFGDGGSPDQIKLRDTMKDFLQH